MTQLEVRQKRARSRANDSRLRSQKRNIYKKDVVKRYHRMCAMCGWFDPWSMKEHFLQEAVGGTILRGDKHGGCEMHHIVSVSPRRNRQKVEGNHDLDNLILLCPNHHVLADAKRIAEDILYKYQEQAPALTKTIYDELEKNEDWLPILKGHEQDWQQMAEKIEAENGK